MYKRISIPIFFTIAIKFRRRKVLLGFDLVTLYIIKRKNSFSERKNRKGKLVLQRL